MWRGLKEGSWAFSCASYQQLASCKFLPAHAERATQQTRINLPLDDVFHSENSDICYLTWAPQQFFKIRTLNNNNNNNQQEPAYKCLCVKLSIASFGQRDQVREFLT